MPRRFIRPFTSPCINLLYWEFVLALAFLTVLDAEFVFGDEHTFLATICKGISRPFSYDFTIGRFYPFTHWDCNFIFLLPAFCRENIPLTFYAFNAITLILMAYCFLRLVQMDRFVEKGHREFFVLSSVLIVFAAPDVFRMFWWNIFPEARMLALEAIALLFFVKGLQNGKSVCYIISAVALTLLLGYKETSFVLIAGFAGSIALFGWRQISKGCRVFVLYCLLLSVCYVLFYLLVVKGQVAHSYADGRQTDVLDAFKQYFCNPFLFTALPVGIVRGVLAFRFKENRHLLYDAMLFAGLAFVFAYVILGMTMSYYPAPAYVFLIPALAHWVNFVAAKNRVLYKLIFLLWSGLLVMWGNQAISDYSEQLAGRRTDLKQVRELAGNTTIEKVCYYLLPKEDFPASWPKNEIFQNYWYHVFRAFYEYAGGDLSRVSCIDKPCEIHEHEVIVYPFLTLPSFEKNATYVNRSRWFTMCYGPIGNGCKRTADGQGIVVDSSAACVSGLYDGEPWGAWGRKNVLISVKIPDDMKGRDLKITAKVGACTSEAHPRNEISLLFNGKRLSSHPAVFPPQELSAVIRAADLPADGKLGIEIRTDAEVCPQDEGCGADTRHLGVAFKSVELRPKERGGE